MAQRCDRLFVRLHRVAAFVPATITTETCHDSRGPRLYQNRGKSAISWRLACVLRHLFSNNQTWAAAMIEHDPEFFERLAHQQTPDYLWIGCSDARVPANQIVGLLPGAMFVH